MFIVERRISQVYHSFKTWKIIWFPLALLTPSEGFMVEIWDDWRRGCSWGEIQPKDNVCARRWHPSAAGASGTDAAPAVRLRAEALPGLSRAARLHQRLQLHGRAVQSARRPGCGEKGQLHQRGADWSSGCRPAAQQDRHSVSWNCYLWTNDISLYYDHPAVASPAGCVCGTEITCWLYSMASFMSSGMTAVFL